MLFGKIKEVSKEFFNTWPKEGIPYRCGVGLIVEAPGENSTRTVSACTLRESNE
jgi:hypothetical protein